MRYDAAPRNTFRVDNLRKRQIAWIEAVMDQHGWSQTRLARKAGTNPSTLSKFFRSSTGAVLDATTVERLARAGGIPPYETAVAAVPRGRAEDEIVEAPRQALTAAIAAIMGDDQASNATQTWRLNSRALEARGYLPGDIMIVDMNAEVRPGDIVLARAGPAAGGARPLVARIFEPPFLVAATLDHSLIKPLIIDGENVAIIGAVTAMLREGRPAARPHAA